MPVLEGWRHGLPVIGSNNSSVGEIIGEAGILFNPFDVRSMYHALDRAISLSESEKEKYIEIGKQKASCFSWNVTAHRAIDILKKRITEKRNQVSLTNNNNQKPGDYRFNPNDKARDTDILEKIWRMSDNKGLKIVEYLRKHGFEKAAIYGLGKWGSRLLNELRNQEIDVVYVIDRRAKYLDDYVPVYEKYDPSISIDVVIITSVVHEYEIIDNLKQVASVPYVSLDDLIMESLNNLEFI